MSRIFLIFVLLLACAAVSLAQTPTPTAAPTLGRFGEVSATDTFTSKEDDFSIAMPAKPSESLHRDESVYTYANYRWQFDGVLFKVAHFTFHRKFPVSRGELEGYFSDTRSAVRPPGANKKSAEYPLEMGSFQGAHFAYTGEKEAITGRMFVGHDQSYLIYAIYDPALPGIEKLIAGTLDSFHIRGEDSPVVATGSYGLMPRPGSDVKDDELKGKVKKVVEESTGAPNNATRLKTREVEYDARGNLKSIVKFTKGLPEMREDYRLYYDGQIYAMTLLKDDPLSQRMQKGLEEKRNGATYDYSIHWKYDEKDRLLEKRVEGPYGHLAALFTYAYMDRVVTVSAGTENAALGYTITRKMDESGNVISESVVISLTTQLNTVTTHKYLTFDDRGNWTSRTTTEKVGAGRTATRTEYRTITYYP